MQAGISRNLNRFELEGDLTVETARSLFDQTPQFDQREVRFNLESVQQVDSAGLALLVYWSNLVRASSGKLKFDNTPKQLQEMAKLTGLDDLFA